MPILGDDVRIRQSRTSLILDGRSPTGPKNGGRRADLMCAIAVASAKREACRLLDSGKWTIAQRFGDSRPVAAAVTVRHDVGVERVSVVGNSGAGKSTLARRLADQLGLVYVELDAIHHLPGWAPINSETFLEQVAARAGSDKWVIDGNYRSIVVDGPVWARADTVVWLDLPRRTVMRRVIGRSVRRVIRREELWNGNKQSWRDLFAWDPERSIIRWSWTQHGKYCGRYSAAMASPDFSHLDFVRLRSSNDIECWLRSLHPDRSST